MDDQAQPRWPRLAGHVAARRHVVGGEPFVILHDERSGRVARIGLREWSVLTCLDGTRDIAGVGAAAALAGVPIAEAQLVQFIEALHASGMLQDGAVAPPASRTNQPIADEVSRQARPAVPALGAPRPEARPSSPSVGPSFSPPVGPGLDRPIAALDFWLRCDGSGACCRSYLTIPLSPSEAIRAASCLPEGMSDGFTPDRGSAFTPYLARAVTTVDGRCCFLDGDDRCRLHDPGLKPHGCTVFPAQLIDDGREVRVGPAPECGCVLKSVGLGPDEAAPLWPAALVRRSQLDPRTFVVTLASRIAIGRADDGSDEHWSRERFLAWSDAHAAQLAGDVPRVLWSLSNTLDAPDAGRDADAPLDAAALAGEAAALREALSQRLALHAYRAASDLAVCVPRWMLAALEEPLVDTPRIDADEAFYLRALWHVHALALDPPLRAALRRRAVRVLVARAMPAFIDSEDPATSHPLALVEAYCRAYGV